MSSSSYTALFSNAAGLLIATLYTIAGQAHFTARFTPGMAAQIDQMTHDCHPAFWFLGIDRLSYTNAKHLLGALDLIAAACLWRKRTRRVGLQLAVLGFAGGVYGEWYSGIQDRGNFVQVCSLLGIAVAGLLASSSHRT